MLKQHAAGNAHVAAALAAYTGKPPEKSNKLKKKEDRAAKESQNRLPAGQYCKAKSCQFDHDVRHPGSALGLRVIAIQLGLDLYLTK